MTTHKYFHNELQLTLFDAFFADPVEDEIKEVVKRQPKRENSKPIKKRQKVVDEEYVFWSDTDIHDLRVGMLMTAVREIRDKRKSYAMRKEAWEWLFDDDDENPFSASNCGRFTGYDISELRRLLLALIPSL